MTSLAPHLSGFLREHLPKERRASQHTCEAYAQSFQLLLGFAANRLKIKPSKIGSDDEKYKDLAEETKLPKERQDTCAGDFSNAAYSWDLVLTPHVRTPDQPEADITVAYREAKGSLEPIANALKSIKLLEAVAVHTAEAFAWPAPFKLEAQSCGFPNARWDIKEHRRVFIAHLPSQSSASTSSWPARSRTRGRSIVTLPA
jgi:hypothetical protein